MKHWKYVCMSIITEVHEWIMILKWYISLGYWLVEEIFTRVNKEYRLRTLWIFALCHFNFYIVGKSTFNSRMNQCSTNRTNGCLEYPRVYALNMEAVAAVRQQPARITNLEVLQTNSTIHKAATFLWFLVIKARKVLQVTSIVTIRHSFHGTSTILALSTTTTMTMIIFSSESPPHYAHMDRYQNCNPYKQDY